MWRWRLRLLNPSITVDGHEIYTDVEPQSINNRTMVPIRVVSEALAANVDYHTDIATDKKTVIITATDGKIVKFQLDSKNITTTKDGKATIQTMDVTPQVKNNRTLVPIRFAAEALDSQVGYDAKTNAVAVNTPTLTVDGKEINTMTLHFNMIMGGKTIGYYGNSAVANFYNLLADEGMEVAAPEKFGTMTNIDEEVYYYMTSEYKFHTGEPQLDKSTGKPNNNNPAIQSYEVYSFMSANPDAKLPTGYTKYLIRNLNTDKWYQYDSADYEKLDKLLNNVNNGLTKSLFNNIV